VRRPFQSPRLLLTATGIATAIIAGGASAALAGGASPVAKTTVHFRNTLIGAEVGGGNENVFDIRGSRRGAGIQFVRPNAAGTGGSYTSTSYFGVGTAVEAGHYTASPGKNGIVNVRSRGRFVRGTGLFKHISGKFTASGTLNPRTGHLRAVVVGTQRY